MEGFVKCHRVSELLQSEAVEMLALQGRFYSGSSGSGMLKSYIE